MRVLLAVAVLFVAGCGTDKTKPDGSIGRDAAISPDGGDATIMDRDGGIERDGGDAEISAADGGDGAVVDPDGGDAAIADRDGGDAEITDSGGGDAAIIEQDAGGSDASSACTTFTQIDGGPFTPPATVERVSVTTAGVEASGQSSGPDVSADGRFVVFAAFASDLVAADTNGAQDVFVRDRLTGITERVSVTSTCTEANGASYWPRISADGFTVAFVSDATNLVVGDTNGFRDVFVRDLLSGVTERISVATDGSQGNDHALSPDLSADGQLVAFSSYATTLVSGDTTGFPNQDVFVRDRVSGTTLRVNANMSGGWSAGTDVAALSADGRYLAYGSMDSDIVPGDTNNSNDVFLIDLLLGTTELISLNSSGELGNVGGWVGHNSVSDDGRFVAFLSSSTNLDPAITVVEASVFVRDRLLGTTVSVSHAHDGSAADAHVSGGPSISGTGRYASFGSYATNLVPNDTNGMSDIFVRDLDNNILVRILDLNGHSLSNALSSDGRTLVFESLADDVVASDTNSTWDVFAIQNPL